MIVGQPSKPVSDRGSALKASFSPQPCKRLRDMWCCVGVCARARDPRTPELPIGLVKLALALARARSLAEGHEPTIRLATHAVIVNWLWLWLSQPTITHQKPG